MEYNVQDLQLAYTKGATKQKEIDIDLICDLMIDFVNEGLIETPDVGNINTMIRRELENKSKKKSCRNCKYFDGFDFKCLENNKRNMALTTFGDGHCSKFDNNEDS